ncbi:MAG: nucleoside hydrolase, partial [Hyphomicrobiaceae bacterium]
MTKCKILIDCDPGHDDAVAILFAARHLELVGVTTVHGNNTIENTTRNALAILELAGLDVPLAVGCADPLAQPRAEIAAVHGKSGLDGVDLP